jgi:hypothetical protein
MWDESGHALEPSRVIAGYGYEATEAVTVCKTVGLPSSPGVATASRVSAYAASERRRHPARRRWFTACILAVLEGGIRHQSSDAVVAWRVLALTPRSFDIIDV